MIKVRVHGFQVFVLVKNDFNLWLTKKIELLQMLEDLKTSLKRKGELRESLHIVKKAVRKLSEPHLQSQNSKQNLLGGSPQKTFLERTLNRLLTSITAELYDSSVNFCLYQDQEKRIEEGNIRRFYSNYLQESSFVEKSMCFRIFSPSVFVNVKTMTDEDIEVQANTEQLLLQSPVHTHKIGILTQVQLLMKIPLDKKLAKDLCNFDIRITVLRGCLNFNKKFLKTMAKWFVSMDALKTAIKRIKRLILKLHFMDQLLKEQNQKDGTEDIYENYKDIDIPKRLKIVIEEGLTIMVTDPNKKLTPFLLEKNEDVRPIEMFSMNTATFTFELLRTLKNSYYLTIQSEKVTLDCNQKRSVTVENFVQELDFMFKKQVSDSALRESRFELLNNIKADSIYINFNMAFYKSILEILSIYKEFVWIASVKHKIMHIILDCDFLKSNLLHMGSSNQDPEREKQILDLFKEIKHKDSISSEIQFKKIQGKFMTFDSSSQLNFEIDDFKLKHKDDKGMEEVNFKSEYFNFQPIKPQSLALIKAMNFEMNMTTTIGNDAKNAIRDINLSYSKGQMNVNFEYVLDITRDILNMTFISKHFSRKWNTKFKVKESKNVIISNFIIGFKETQMIWNLSQNRMIAYRVLDLETKHIQCPFKKDSKIGMNYFCKKFTLYHSLYKLDQIVPGEIYCLADENKEVDQIIDVTDFDFKMTSNDHENKIKFISSGVDFNMTDNLQFGAIIFEKMKQISVAKKLIAKEYLNLKRKTNFQFNKQKRSSILYTQPQQQFVPAKKGRKKALLLQIEVLEGLLKADDNKIKELFVNKSEIVDTLQEREIFKCKPDIVFKLLKRLKLSQINEKAMILQVTNFKMIYDIPQQFLDFNKVYQIVLKLDEAKEYMNPQLFKSFDSCIHTYSCDYLAMHGRNMQKPIAEIWELDFKFLIINASLNASQNQSLFKTKIYDKIFKKYEIQKNFNKLVSKIYYDSDLKCKRLRLQFQGQQTMLFFNDFGSIFERFDFQDLSSTKDPRKQKLNYYQGLDRLRNRMHGKCKFNIQKLDCLIYPKRKFNRYDSYLLITCQDLVYRQNLNYQEVCLRNLLIIKQPLKSFETSIIKLPLLEFIITIAYNQNKSLNHFAHNGAQNISQYLDQLKSYSSQEVELDCKLNIPSLGTRNDVEKNNKNFINLMKNYIEHSPIPVIHYQRSHMKFFDSLYKEYVVKKDRSGPVIRRRNNKGGQSKIKNQRKYLFKIKGKTFLNDLMVLFTDYKESNQEEAQILQQKQSKKNLDLSQERDQFLDRYEGLIFTQENLCFRSAVTIKKFKEKNNIELKNGYFQCNFLKLAYLNSNNLFQIRHPCFKEIRQNQFETSFDNYKYFCQFFEIQPNNNQVFSSANEMQFSNVLQNFKTIVPHYIAKNSLLQQEIMLATLNPNSVNPFQQDDFNTFYDDFVFLNTDTIGTLITLVYYQDKEIQISKEKEVERKAKKHNPLILDKPVALNDQEKLMVKHLFEVKDTKFLYTKRTKELITHHLIKGFKYSQFRKTDFIDVEAAKETRNFFNDYDAQFSKGGRSINENSAISALNILLEDLKKMALVAIRCDDLQINFQNELTKSQMVLASVIPTTAVIYAYSQIGNLQNSFNKTVTNINEDLLRTKSGYNLNIHEEIVRYQLCINLNEMEIYVAPTSINLDNPTFWLQSQDSKSNNHSLNNSQTQNQENNRAMPPSDRELKNNVLRKIFQVKNINFKFDFLEEEFVDHYNAKNSIDIVIEKLVADMNGPNMWHFIYVLKSILFDRGEKAAEMVLIEQKRSQEMSTMNIDIIKSIIDQKMKKFFMHGNSEYRYNLDKKVSYSILNGEFKLWNFDTKYAQVQISKASGTHLIYTNRESKIDIDVDRILIENYADSEDYRMVLFPGYSLSAFDGQYQPQVNPENMIKFRARDKFVVVKEAPWRVFDQFEFFIYPTSIQFTKNFFKHFRNFFFEDQIVTNPEKTLEEDEKYELLVPTKQLKKAQQKSKPNSKTQEDLQEMLTGRSKVSVLEQTKGGIKKYFKSKNTTETQKDNSDDESIISIPTQNINNQNQGQLNIPPSEHPIFFRYMRLNEVGVSLTYFHEKNSFFNSKDVKIKISPWIRHAKFVTFKGIFVQYESHCKKNFISQIPSLIKQKLLQTREKLDGFNKSHQHYDLDDDDDQIEQRKEFKLHDARKLLFGEFYF